MSILRLLQIKHFCRYLCVCVQIKTHFKRLLFLAEKILFPFSLLSREHIGLIHQSSEVISFYNTTLEISLPVLEANNKEAFDFKQQDICGNEGTFHLACSVKLPLESICVFVHAQRLSAFSTQLLQNFREKKAASYNRMSKGQHFLEHFGPQQVTIQNDMSTCQSIHYSIKRREE